MQRSSESNAGPGKKWGGEHAPHLERNGLPRSNRLSEEASELGGLETTRPMSSAQFSFLKPERPLSDFDEPEFELDVDDEFFSAGLEDIPTAKEIRSDAPDLQTPPVIPAPAPSPTVTHRREPASADAPVGPTGTPSGNSAAVPADDGIVIPEFPPNVAATPVPEASAPLPPADPPRDKEIDRPLQPRRRGIAGAFVAALVAAVLCLAALGYLVWETAPDPAPLVDEARLEQTPAESASTSEIAAARPDLPTAPAVSADAGDAVSDPKTLVAEWSQQLAADGSAFAAMDMLLARLDDAETARAFAPYVDGAVETLGTHVASAAERALAYETLEQVYPANNTLQTAYAAALQDAVVDALDAGQVDVAAQWYGRWQDQNDGAIGDDAMATFVDATRENLTLDEQLALYARLDVSGAEPNRTMVNQLRSEALRQDAKEEIARGAFVEHATTWRSQHAPETRGEYLRTVMPVVKTGVAAGDLDASDVDALAAHAEQDGDGDVAAELLALREATWPAVAEEPVQIARIPDATAAPEAVQPEAPRSPRQAPAQTPAPVFEPITPGPEERPTVTEAEPARPLGQTAPPTETTSETAIAQASPAAPSRASEPPARQTAVLFEAYEPTAVRISPPVETRPAEPVASLPAAAHVAVTGPQQGGQTISATVRDAAGRPVANQVVKVVVSVGIKSHYTKLLTTDAQGVATLDATPFINEARGRSNHEDFRYSVTTPGLETNGAYVTMDVGDL